MERPYKRVTLKRKCYAANAHQLKCCSNKWKTLFNKPELSNYHQLSFSTWEIGTCETLCLKLPLLRIGTSWRTLNGIGVTPHHLKYKSIRRAQLSFDATLNHSHRKMALLNAANFASHLKNGRPRERCGNTLNDTSTTLWGSHIHANLTKLLSGSIRYTRILPLTQKYALKPCFTWPLL